MIHLYFINKLNLKSMKKIVTISATLFFLFSNTISGQYTNATLNGAWKTHTDEDTYIIFDGKGTITELGVIGGSNKTSIGTYSVVGSSFTGMFTIWGLPFTGKITNANTGTISVIGLGKQPITKVSNQGALSDSLSGTFSDDSTSTSKNITLYIDTTGTITSAKGLNDVKGHVYTQGGVLTGYVSSSDGTNGSCWKEMQIVGTYANDSTSGKIIFNCKGHGGKFSMIRNGIHFTPNNQNSIASSKNSQIKVYPIPFKTKINIELPSPDASEIKIKDINSNIVFSNTYETQNIEIDNLDNLAVGGVYFIEIKQKSNVSNIRIFKQ